MITLRLSLSVSTLDTDQKVPNTGSDLPGCSTEIAQRDFMTLSVKDSGAGWKIFTTVPSSVVKVLGQSCCCEGPGPGCCCGGGACCAKAVPETRRTVNSMENIVRMLLICYCLCLSVSILNIPRQFWCLIQAMSKLHLFDYNR